MEVNKPVSTIIIAVVTLLVVFLFVWPKYQEARDLELRLAQKQAEYSGKSMYYAKINALLAEVHSRQQSIDKITDALPDQFSLAEVVHFLSQQAEANGLVLRSTTFSEAPALPMKTMVENASREIQETALTVDLSGNYERFKDFLASVEDSSRLFEINSVSLSPLEGVVSSKSAANQLVFKLEITVKSY